MANAGRVRKTRRKEKEETIKKKILRGMLLAVILSLLVTGITSICLNYISTVSLLKQMMSETAVITSQRVSYELASYKNVAYEVGSIARLASSETSLNDKKAIMEQRAATHNFVGYNIIGTDGISIFDGKDYKNRQYVQEALKGEAYISEPLISQLTGELSIMVAAPLWKNGIPDTEVVGVVYFKPVETFLNDIMNSIHVSDNSGVYMINSTGTTIADTTLDTITIQNIEKEAASDSSLKGLSEIHQKMCKGESGFGSYFMKGIEKVAAYAPVDGTDGWSLAVTAPLMDFMDSTFSGIIIFVVLLILTVIAAGVYAIRMATGISNPIRSCVERIKKLSEGDLKSEVPVIQTKDETRELAEATKTIVNTMSAIISDLSYGLEEMAQGNFAIQSKDDGMFVGDFAPLATAMYSILEKLSMTLKRVNEGAEQVSMGAVQLAENSQSIAEGASEQAGAVEELTATVESVASTAKESAKRSETSAADTRQAAENAEQGKKSMQALVSAMENINNVSMDIQKIINSIEDIASQTNLLSLNASIEAARAGEAGKGFAVVANQIGKLANDSAQSAVETRELINKSLKEIENGNVMTQEAAEVLESTIADMIAFAEVAKTTSEAAVAQTEMLEQIQGGIEQIATVVQSNSAAAEENSATSEELAASSESLKELIGQFKFL